MAEILFSHSYFYRFDPKQWANKQPYPPYGTLIAAAWMRENGHSVSLFDTNLAPGSADLDKYLNKNPKYLVLYDDGFNYLTKMCLTRMREEAFKMIRVAKSRGCTVIVSSSDSTDHFEKYLDQGADYILIGEGEETLLELVSCLETSEGQPENIAGLALKNQNKALKTAPRPVLRNLDSLPQAAWDLVDIPAYKNIWQQGSDRFSLNIATTRGCPYKCNWCAKPIYGNRYNTRSPEKVVDEIEFLIQKFGPRHFWVSDDIFGLKPGWVQKFRELVEQRNLRFQYKIQSRADLLLKEDTIDALAASGLEEVWIGAESGSQHILDAMDKGTTVEQIYQSTRLLKSKGVRVAFFLQFGYLGETMQDIEATFKMLLDLMPDDIGVSVSYPLPGTKFHEKVKAELSEKANWTDSDDLDLMFRNTYSPEFYKQLHRYLHKLFRRQQSLDSLKLLFRNPGGINRQRTRSALATLYYLPTTFLERQRLQKIAPAGEVRI